MKVKNKRESRYLNCKNIGSDFLCAGVVFIGISVASIERCERNDSYTSMLIFMLMSLMCFLTGIVLKCMASKKASEEQKQELPDAEEQRKFEKVLGRWIVRIAVTILCINGLCRVMDAVESKNYVMVMGTVERNDVHSTRVGRKTSANSHISVKYERDGGRFTDYVSEVHVISFYQKGQSVPVMYHKESFYEAYIAKRDWMTGAYLPAGNNYNISFIISMILFVFAYQLMKEKSES